MDNISGLFTALVTPFDATGELDEISLRQLIRYQVSAKVDGIVVLGTTGEAPTLTSQEKERIITIAREETAGKVHLMVGTGSYSTAQTIENTKLAKDLGADSVLVVSPYYNRPTQEGIYLHYKAVAEKVEIPLLLYNVQTRTGQNMSCDTIVKLSQLPNICGIKEAPGNNLAQINDILALIKNHNPQFTVMSGDDLWTFSSMTLGGDGVISVISNLLAHPVKALVKALQTQEFDKARELHFALLPFVRAAFIETSPSPIKFAMNTLGLIAGPCRLPLCPLQEENKKLIETTLNSLSPWVNMTETTYLNH